MRLRRRHAVRGVGVVCLVASLYLMRRDAPLATAVEQAALAGSLLATGLTLGWAQYRHDAASDRSDRPFFDSPTVYVGFWALHWVLFAVALGTLHERAVGAPLSTVVAPVPAGVLLVVVWAVALLKGGVYEAADPRHWVAAYRDGKRSARSD